MYIHSKVTVCQACDAREIPQREASSSPAIPAVTCILTYISYKIQSDGTHSPSTQVEETVFSFASKETFTQKSTKYPLALHIIKNQNLQFLCEH